MSSACSEHGARTHQLRVIDILREAAPELSEHRLSYEQHRALSDILKCRTPALGGQELACPQCGQCVFLYRSCGNRHCPNCQAAAQDEWIAQRQQAMLPVPHFHLVFTLPAQLRGLCRAYPHALYALLLRTCGDVLVTLGADTLKAQLGVTAILHTWTRDLRYHVHAHCIVSAGGWDHVNARFQRPRQSRYLFPVSRIKALFRARFLRGLRGLVQHKRVALPNGLSWPRFEASLPKAAKWVVYAEAPISQFANVVAYLGRYTHRVGISDARLRAVTVGSVRFATRDGKLCTLSKLEFARRFLQHILPDGFKKIRHYGLYAGAAKYRNEALAALGGRQPSDSDCPAPSPETASTPPERPSWRERRCPNCHVLLELVCLLPEPRAPPDCFPECD